VVRLDAPALPAGHDPGMTSATSSPTGTSWRMARATAPLTRLLAGRRFFPLWAVVHHVGRTSGRALRVPVAVTPTPDGLLVNLPWGPRTNWVRNVTAAGGCTLRWKGRDVRCDRPEVLDATRARPYYSAATWAVARRVFGGTSFLVLHPVP
jgi:deazaflavin-dependent oxidoreductase (nitroreductase family)